MSVLPLERLPTPAQWFARALRERWIKVAGFVFAVAVLTAVLALLMKPWYTAVTTLLPPTETSDAFGSLASLIESSTLNRIGLFSTSTPSDIYVDILNSRRLRESLARRFDLMRRYDLKTMRATLKELDQHLKVSTTPTGIIVISVEDMDQKTCADMANFLVAELDRFNRETLNTRGKRTRMFLEKRLAEVEQRMIAADAAVTAYEQKHKIVLAANDATLRGVADVLAQRMSLEVQRSYVESYSGPDNSGVRQLDAEIGAFDSQLARLPQVKNEGARLALDAEIQRKVFSFLTAQFEQARVEEMRDTPTVSVLDPGQPPEIRTRPRRTIMVLTAAFIASLLALAWVGFSARRVAHA